ncbi:alpha/beta fold hydrolase [Rhodobacteraceae bacterium D3-12]|nr:alpha/beta fold hydrolase [Rhodobacteraceae bacterium D3-12]
MRVFGKWVGRVLLLLIAVGMIAWQFGPYEPVDVSVERFEPRRFGEGVQVYLESVEAGIKDLTEGVEKRVVWAGQSERRTPVSVLYIHGFSATSEEIRPVPDRVAQALGANLVFTRLTGHGRPGAALSEATVRDWMADMEEGLAVARAVGDEVVVIATSTGATLAAEAAVQPEMVKGVRAMIFVSPNFGINDPRAALLTMPGARYVLPLIAGSERSWEPQNDAHATFWTTRYPSAAVFPMAALVKHAVALDYSGVDIPALFYLSPQDKVVTADVSRSVAERWGGGAELVMVPDGAAVEPSHHVIAGDILSPGNTEATVAIMLDWLAKVE